MHDLKAFQYHTHEFRSIQDGDQFLFVAKDVCSALELDDVSKACQNLPEDEKLIRTLFVSGQSRNMLCVTESGLYRLIFRSNKPEAEVFRTWVFSEVLPTLRKTGSYAMQGVNTTNDEVLGLYRDTKALLEENNRLLKQQLEDAEDRIAKRRFFTPDEDAQVINLHKQGLSPHEIGLTIDRKKESVRSCLRRLKRAGVYESEAKAC